MSEREDAVKALYAFVTQEGWWPRWDDLPEAKRQEYRDICASIPEPIIPLVARTAPR